MDSQDKHERKNCLFPLSLLHQQTAETHNEEQTFTSFKPPNQTEPEKLESLLSSEEEEDSVAGPSQSVDKKRTRSGTLGILKRNDAKRHKKEEADSWFSDKKGDRSNLTYQGIYRLDVPSYTRITAMVDAYSKAKMPQSTERYFAQRWVFKERSKKVRRMRFGARGSKWRRPSEMETADIVYLDDGQFNEIPGDDEMLTESLEEYVLRRTKEFNVKLREDPYDMELWLKFASFQDEANAMLRRRVATTSTTEKKVSILSNALKYHPKNERLLAELLELTSTISAPEQTHEKYQAMLSRLPHSLCLWNSYWTYVKSVFAEFSYEHMRGIYEGGLKGIHDAIRTRSTLMIESSRAEDELIACFLKGVQFDFQTGYDERAIAKIQASLEWIYCSPSNKSALSEAQLHRLFKEFWECSQIPKVGEKGARGFAAFVDEHVLEPAPVGEGPHQPDVAASDPVKPQAADAGWSGWFELGTQLEDDAVREESDEEESSVSENESDNEQETEDALMKKLGLKLRELENVTSISPDALEKFLALEQSRSSTCFLPLKPDVADEVDVDRLVLFEELQPLLFDIKEISSKKKLLLGILMLLGLLPIDKLLIECWKYSGIQESTDCVSARIFEELNSWFQGSLTQSWASWYQLDISREMFLLKLLEFFATQLFQGDIRLRKLWLMTAVDMESRFGGRTVDPKKIGRQILDGFKDDINLWTAYGSVLSKYGKWKETKRVWKAVVKAMIKSIGSNPYLCPESTVFEILEASQPDPGMMPLLMFLGTADTSHLDIYVSSMNQSATLAGVIPSEEVMLQCNTLFKQGIDHALHIGLDWSSYEHIICSIYFKTLRGFEDRRAFSENHFYAYAANFLQEILLKLPADKIRQSKPCEALHEKYCFWRMKSVESPKQIRSALFQSLALYPLSISLLMMLIESHVSSYTISSLLATLKSHLIQNTSTEIMMLVVLLEMLTSLKNVNVPGLFERILKMDRGRYSAFPVVWCLYLEFVAAHASSDFKRVFLRSIRSCPWSKAIWLKGLRLSNTHLTGAEVADFLETMKEKGVRLRTDIYEILLEEAAGDDDRSQ